MTQRRQSSAWSAWRAWQQGKGSRHARLHAALSHWTATACTRAWARWRTTMSTTIRARTLARSITQQGLAAVLHGWATASARRRLLRALLGRAAARACRRRLHGCWLGWEEVGEARREGRRRLARALQPLLLVPLQLDEVWAAWWGVVQAGRPGRVAGDMLFSRWGGSYSQRGWGPPGVLASISKHDSLCTDHTHTHTHTHYTYHTHRPATHITHTAQTAPIVPYSYFSCSYSHMLLFSHAPILTCSYSHILIFSHTVLIFSHAPILPRFPGLYSSLLLDRP